MGSLFNTRLITLAELQEYIKNDTAGNEALLQSIINRVSKRFDEYCHRSFVERVHTEYYDGDGSPELILNNMPVTRVVSLYDDIDRDFPSSDLISADDYVIYTDEGIVKLFNDEGVFQTGIQNIKVTYWAGYKTLQIETGVNDALDFTEDGGSELNATLTANDYDVETLATHIATVLTAAGSSTYSVEFNYSTNHFEITTSEGTALVFKWNTGTNASTNAAQVLGFDSSADGSSTTTETSDFEVLPIPEDIKEAACQQATWNWRQSFAKDGIVGMTSKSVAGQTVSFLTGRELLPEVKSILAPYVVHPYGNRNY